jgi:hypothetical protein
MGVALLFILGATVASTPSPEPTLTTVSAKRLAQSGIQLLPPDAQPAIDKATAEQLASRRGPSGSTTAIREAVLAKLLDESLNSGKLVWVVSLDPSGFRSHGPATATPWTATFFIVFIDAKTGQWLGSEAG